MSENNEIVPAEGAEVTVANPAALISELAAGNAGVYSTMDVKNFDDRVALFEAVTSATPVRDLGTAPIMLRHVVVQAVDVRQRDGSLTPSVRTIFIADDGKAYSAVSEGLFKSVQGLFGIIGHPNTWDKPLPVQIVTERGRQGYDFMTLRLVRN